MIDASGQEWIFNQFAVILSAAMDRDSAQVADAIGETGLTYGHEGVYAVCCALAETVRKLGFPDFEQGNGTLTGDIAIVEKSEVGDQSPASLWAVRFIVAYMNGDSATSTALFYGPLESGDEPAQNALIAGVVALITIAADIARPKEDEL